MKDGDMEVIANAALSYESFKIAASKVRNESDEYKSDPLVKDIQFFNSWVHGLKQRFLQKKRRMTTTLKKKPSQEEVRIGMKKIQQKIIQYKIKNNIQLTMMKQQLLLAPSCFCSTFPKAQYALLIPTEATREN